jgi:cytochrome c biogenesis protein ResB
MGLLVIIAAALYGLAFQKRGFVQMIRTETFSGEDEDWPQKRLGVFARDFDLGFEVRLDEFVPTHWENDQVKDLETDLTVIDRKGLSHKFLVSPGNPIRYKGTKIYQTIYYGYALGFVLKKGDGNEEGTHFLLDAPGKKDQPFKGKMDFPTTDYVLDMKFHPNLVEPSFSATLPGVYLTVTEKEEERFDGRVLFSQTARLGKDSLTFAQIHHWTGLAFVKNSGMPLLYCGFALGTLGAILIFWLPYKQVHVRIAGDNDQIHILMGGRTKRYTALFPEEFNETAERLQRRLVEYGYDSVTQV